VLSVYRVTVSVELNRPIVHWQGRAHTLHHCHPSQNQVNTNEMGDMKGSGYQEPWELQVGETWWEDLSEMPFLTEESLLGELERQYTGK
jgi:hypothetical protein